MTKWARKRDANEPGIVAAAQAAGASVFRVDSRDIPDLLLFHRGRVKLVEVKNPGGRNTLEPGQRRLLEAARLAGCADVHIVTSPEEMIEVLNGDTNTGCPR